MVEDAYKKVSIKIKTNEGSVEVTLKQEIKQIDPLFPRPEVVQRSC